MLHSLIYYSMCQIVMYRIAFPKKVNIRKEYLDIRQFNKLCKYDRAVKLPAKMTAIFSLSIFPFSLFFSLPLWRIEVRYSKYQLMSLTALKLSCLISQTPLNCILAIKYYTITNAKTFG